MKTLLLGLFGILGACSADQPNVKPQTEQAVKLVWEGVYGMEAESAPKTEWQFTTCEHDTAFGVSVPDECLAYTVFDDGTIQTPWTGSVSTSSWTQAAQSIKVYLMTGEFQGAETPAQVVELAKAQAALVAAGL